MAPIKDYRSEFQDYYAQKATYVTYAVQLLMYVVSSIGGRHPGSEEQQKAQRFFMADLQHYVNTVAQEPYTFHPKAFMGFIPICSFLMIPSVFFYNFKFRKISFIMCTTSVALFLGEFLFYREFCDFLFPSAPSSNVVGIRNATGTVQRVAIFNGHTDSMWQWEYNYLGGGHLLVFVIVYAVGGMIIFEILQIVFFKEYQNWIAIFEMFFLPAYVAIAYMTNFTVVVEGANDNLSGCVTAMAVVKYLNDNNITFEHTEVRVLLSGDEEAGLRGAKRYAAAHPYADEVAQGKEVAFFCFDTIRDLDSMAVYNKDMTGLVSHDTRVCSIMRRAGELGGLDLPYATVFCGSTDAAAMTQAGFPSGSFAALNPTPADYYHTLRDNIQNLEPIAIGHSIDVAMGSLFIFDQEGLDGKTSHEKRN